MYVNLLSIEIYIVQPKTFIVKFKKNIQSRIFSVKIILGIQFFNNNGFFNSIIQNIIFIAAINK